MEHKKKSSNLHCTQALQTLLQMSQKVSIYELSISTAFWLQMATLFTIALIFATYFFIQQFSLLLKVTFQ